jgi:YidC/Oxa1 family membrane protein insertase
VNKKLHRLLLVSALLFAAVALTGCGIPQGEVDLNAPPGWWEAVIVYPVAKVLIFMHDVIEGAGIPYGYGWAIILLTLFLKIVTLPLTLKQLQSTKAMQALQPRMRELQEKYGKDRQKLAEEQTKLYREAKVNPLGGCLPLLVQLPILWGLYQALYVLANPSVGELQGAGFYWIGDLSFPDLTTGTGWIATSFTARNWGMLFAYASLPIIMIVSQLILQKMSQPAKSAQGGAKDPQSQMMNQMMFFMPIMFGYITLGLPSGLTLYWTVSNILGIVQQYFITGWGGLVDWIPALNRTATAAASSPVQAPPSPPPPSTADERVKPVIKRRRRRK